jgi:hypothetical protein
VKFRPELRKDEITSDQFSSLTSAIGIASRFS